MENNHPKIIDYAIVRARNHYDLAEQVNEFIKEGYQPRGELVIDERLNSESYHQVVVKYEEIKHN